MIVLVALVLPACALLSAPPSAALRWSPAASPVARATDTPFRPEPLWAKVKKGGGKRGGKKQRRAGGKGFGATEVVLDDDAVTAAAVAEEVSAAPVEAPRGPQKDLSMDDEGLEDAVAGALGRWQDAGAAEVATAEGGEAARRRKQRERKRKLQKAKAELPSDFNLPAFLLSRLTPEQQTTAERVLVAGLVLSVTVFVVGGVAVTAEAFAVSSKTAVPEGLEQLVVKYVEPSFTPSLGATFLCSSLWGTLKYLQLQQPAAQYVEKPDDRESEGEGR